MLSCADVRHGGVSRARLPSQHLRQLPDPEHPEPLMISDDEVLELTQAMTPDDTRLLATKGDQHWIVRPARNPKAP